MENIADIQRTHTCGQLRAEDVGKKVVLMGWVHRRRDLGGLIFIDLRDRYGMTQCFFSPDKPEIFEKAEKIRSEYVLAITGEVRERPGDNTNENLKTGQVEVIVQELRLLNQAKPAPIPLNEKQNVDENTRMQYRYVDLRRKTMTRNIVLRHKLSKSVRDFLDQKSFLEIETPTLVRSTPEGARDYLVPSRIHEGCFYALPQSPQIFKQLLMVGGLDRYFQIARCYRDEDLRADRQPEFTQIDMEMSFVKQEDILVLVEEMLQHVFKEVMEVELPTSFRRMSYDEALNTYGSDKPELRFEMPLQNVGELVSGTSFGVFEKTLESGGVIKALVVPGQAGISRKIQSEWDALAKKSGLGGLFFIAHQQEGTLKSSLEKHLGMEKMERLAKEVVSNPGDMIVLSAGKSKVVNQGLGRLRLHFGKTLGLIDQDRFEFAWVLDFPLFSLSDEGELEPEHHPFTAPLVEDMCYWEDEPLKVRASAYDLVLNGNELASGSVRIYQRPMQEKLFERIGIAQEEAKEKFGFLLKAFEYGAPPHAGVALGFDRMVAICANADSIRDVLAFPKSTSAYCPMTQAPFEASSDQLDVLNLKVVRKEKEETTVS